MTREQYIKIRGQLLKKLQKEGEISEEDLKKISNSTNTGVYQKEEKVYSLFDWVIIALGLTAAAVLGLVLYT
ncbi:MAG: hypothetical protein GY784_01085 [Gammaproteobacteria bacterium]|nr:hypothetical protein [Gammaproteobacteria bacterium]